MTRKKMLGIGIVLLGMCPLQMQAQSTLLKQVLLTINSEDGVYAKGDTIKIYGQLTEPLDKPLTMTIYEDGKRMYRTTREMSITMPIELDKEPKLIYTAVYQRTKAIIVSVSAGTAEASMVGFIVAPEELRPGFEVPADFMRFWNEQKAKLRQTTPEVKLTAVKLKGEDAGKYLAYYVEITMPEGNPVRGYLAMPKGAKPKSLPIYMRTRSAGVAGDWCHARVETALEAAKRGNGAIGFDFNAHGYPEGLPNDYYVGLENGELKDYSIRPLVDRESIYYRLMYLRELRALDYLCLLPEWDGKRALVHGGSQGGGQAEALAGLDERITAVVATVPAMTDYGGIRQHRQSGWPAPYEKYAATELGESILPYIDGAMFLQFTKARLFMISGLIDETCHAGCVHAAYNVAISPDKQIHTFPYRWHSGTNAPHDQRWNATVGKRCDEFIDEVLR